jgi:peptide deformylase
MYNAAGAGLAGPQIGIQNRIFVIDLPDQEWKGVFINPLILSYTGEDTVMEEGCLSLPGISGPVVRKDKIGIEYYDENWNYHQETYQGIRSRVIQHEYDHLEGVLWIDRVDPGVGIKLLESLKMITNKQVEVTYPII